MDLELAFINRITLGYFFSPIFFVIFFYSIDESAQKTEISFLRTAWFWDFIEKFAYKYLLHH